MNHTERKQAFQDKNLVCCDCGNRFVWEAGEQVYFKDRSLLPPRRCPECRLRRRQTLHPPMDFDEAIKRANALFPDNTHQGVP